MFSRIAVAMMLCFALPARAFVSSPASLPRLAARRGLNVVRAAATAPAASEADAATTTGKIAIVTGASRGIGKAIALELGKAGCRVVVNYASSAGPAEDVVSEIKAMGGTADAVAVKANCGSEEEIQSLFEACESTWGEGQTCDILVNNAGITKDGLAVRMSEQQFRDVIDVNLVGVFIASREAANIMLRKRAGRIINISSVVGQIGNAGQANYAAAKGGVIAMTLSNAREFAKRGVTVNCVCPGFISSDMTDELSDSIVESVKGTIPLNRFGQPEEVAGMVRFLAVDPAASYCTGGIFQVDGGMAMGAA